MWKSFRRHCSGQPRSPACGLLGDLQIRQAPGFLSGRGGMLCSVTRQVRRGPAERRRACGASSRSHQLRGCPGPGPRGTDCKAPERQAGGQAGNTEGCSSSRRQPCQVGEAALTGNWQVPARRVPKGTESGATACVSGHVGAGAQPGRPGAASLPRVSLSWHCPMALQPMDP